MTDNEIGQIIKDVIKAHWPNWEFPPEETRVWMKALYPYDFERAKEAINDLYMTWEKDRYPKPAHIINAISKKAQKKKNVRTVPLFGIFRADHRRRWRDFCGDADTPRQEIEQIAEQICKRANEIESGHYIMYYNTDGEEDTGYYGEPGCSIAVRRRQARDKAFRDILNGQDNKTRRWLVKYLNRDKTAQRETSGGPVHIGEALAESVVL